MSSAWAGDVAHLLLRGVALLAVTIFAVACLDWTIESGDAEADGDADVDGDIDGDADSDADADGDSDADIDGDADSDSDSDVDTDADPDLDVDQEIDLDIDVDAAGLTCAETIECARDWCDGGPSGCFVACMEYSCTEAFDETWNLNACMLDPCTMQCLLDMGCWVCLQNNCPEQYEACQTSGC